MIVEIEGQEYDLSNEAVVLALGADKLVAHFGSKSNAIRGLAKIGHKAGPISRALGILFQHARNVMNQPLKRVIKAERDAAAAAAEKAKSESGNEGGESAETE